MMSCDRIGKPVNDMLMHLGLPFLVNNWSFWIYVGKTPCQEKGLLQFVQAAILIESFLSDIISE